eukprot:TRINITY_DN239_c0_g1_i2.p1 TRINITY_DN239_c0_g1~~TRINITY_DN239_c0_g1_i2.p1  ORF type:complete len:222 (-),score=52.83 TRINITY_DN239_c0_g1_i2:120-785(-)
MADIICNQNNSVGLSSSEQNIKLMRRKCQSISTVSFLPKESDDGATQGEEVLKQKQKERMQSAREILMQAKLKRQPSYNPSATPSPNNHYLKKENLYNSFTPQTPSSPLNFQTPSSQPCTHQPLQSIDENSESPYLRTKNNYQLPEINDKPTIDKATFEKKSDRRYSCPSSATLSLDLGIDKKKGKRGVSSLRKKMIKGIMRAFNQKRLTGVEKDKENLNR